MAEKGKQKNWIKFRHRVVRNVAYAILWPYARIKYNIKVDKFKEQQKRPYLVLLNHQTPFDQFFVGMSFRGPVYYLATEDIFSLGFVSSIIRYLVAPIPIKKQTVDIQAVKTCIRVAQEGGTICIAPEGNRTYSGKTEYMNPAIASLAKKLGMPVALYRIEGGYGSQPRWADKVRRGKMHSYVSRVIMPEEYSQMTNEELFSAIQTGLYVDEANANTEFKSKKPAEYLERAMYICPFCGLSSFESNKDEIKCKKCGRRVVYRTTTQLSGVGFKFPFSFVSEWYDYQKDFVNELDTTRFTENPLYRDVVSLFDVIVNKKKILINDSVEMALYGDRIVFGEGKENEQTLNFANISVISVLGRNKLNIYQGKKVYQIKGDKRFNALKYVHIFNRSRNIMKGETNGKFLGL